MDYVDLIFKLLETRGEEAYLGEPVSQKEHALQAAHLAAREGASDSLVAGALLHDIGHLLGEQPQGGDPKQDALHEGIASAWLSRGFGPEVTEPIRLHVIAKRYLCTVDPVYRQVLSPASILSLELQGGLLSAEDARNFERNLFHKGAIQLRRWDDRAKVPGLPVPAAEHYRPVVRRAASK